MTRSVQVSALLLATACVGHGAAATDMTQPAPVTVGQDLDERVPRALSMACPLPRPFYDALTSLAITPQELAQPDLLISFASDPNRLHWTDDLRRQGDLVPHFGCMVAADVEAALALGDV